MLFWLFVVAKYTFLCVLPLNWITFSEREKKNVPTKEETWKKLFAIVYPLSVIELHTHTSAYTHTLAME